MEILSTYRDFKRFEPSFIEWRQKQELRNQKAQNVLASKPVTQDVLKEQQRAKTLVNILTSIDEYAQTKAEDVDSVSQTLLYVSVGALGAVGTFLGKNIASHIKNQKIAKSLPSAMGVGFALATFLPVVRSTVHNQVRANRIARFDGIHSDKLFHINNFAVLTPEQEKEAQKKADKISDNTIENHSFLLKQMIYI